MSNLRLFSNCSILPRKPSRIACVAEKNVNERLNINSHIVLSNSIYSIIFSFTFNALTMLDCSHHLRFPKNGIHRLLDFLAWLIKNPPTHNNGMDCHQRCVYEFCFVAVFSSSSENFNYVVWKVAFSSVGDILKINLKSSRNTVRSHVSPTHSTYNKLSGDVGFVYCTVPENLTKRWTSQRVALNKHKKMYSLEYQTVSAPDELDLHITSPTERKWHDLSLYTRIRLKENLKFIIERDGKTYWLLVMAII